MRPVMHGFDGKIVFVAGAACDLGWQLLPILKDAGARVILMDEDTDALCDMASIAPHQFEPLPVPDPSVKSYGQIGQIWGDQPLDYLIDLMPLQKKSDRPQWAETNLALVCGLKPGLDQTNGAVLSVIPQSTPDDPLTYQMSEAGLCRMAKVLGERWRKDGVFYNVLRPEKDSSVQDILNAICYVSCAADVQLSGLSVPLTPALD